MHIILKGIKKFSNVRIEDSIHESDNGNELDVSVRSENNGKNNYELMRICRLNRIKIKNPEKWDKAKYDDFVGN